MQLVKAIVHQARRSAQDPAIAFGGGVASFGSLMGSVSAAVEVLRTLGIQPGALVVLDIRNPIHHTAMIYALALLGIRSASVGTAYVTQQAGPRPTLFLTDRDDLADSELPVRKVDARWFAFDETKPVDYAGLMAMPGFPNPDDVFRYVYSSGTTGKPKCVAITNRVIELRVAHAYQALPQRALSGATLNMMGFSTIAGTLTPLIAHTAGSLLCFSSSYADALNLSRLFGVSWLMGAVIQIDGLLKALGSATPPPSLRCVLVAGSKLPLRMLAEIRSRLSNLVLGGYGSTELGLVSFSTSADFERHEGSAGHMMPWAAAQAVSDAGEVLPPGDAGTLRIKCDELAFYVDEQGRPAETTQDGWFYPGDFGRIEPDGLVIVTGRTGDIINRGGVIVAPELIEEVLRLDPAVTDVAVVGVANAAGIDEIWAAIVSPAPLDGEGLIRAARQKLNERVPDRLFQIDAVPRNENGKVMRNVLREELRRRLEA
ncbi:MAG: class I adenylate-forming enzyme family protein [Devosia sp.]